MDKLDEVDKFRILHIGRILDKTIDIVNRLAENDLADTDGIVTTNDFDQKSLRELIIEARKLRENRYWEYVLPVDDKDKAK